MTGLSITYRLFRAFCANIFDCLSINFVNDIKFITLLCYIVSEIQKKFESGSLYLKVISIKWMMLRRG